MIHPHTETIQYIIDKYKFTSYLEIGVHDPSKNFGLIRCKFKIGVDPNPQSRASFTGTSDEFFKQWIDYRDGDFYGHHSRFDIIFIDGDHEHQQVKRDFDNAMQCLNEGGIILLHDTNPEREEYTHVPRDKPRRWNGNVMFFLWDLAKMNDVDYRTIAHDANGLTIVKKSKCAKYTFPDFEQSYTAFDNNRILLTRLVNKEQFYSWV